MADPVSWLQIEHGWSVVSSDGAELGSVTELTGDRDADIFDGLAVSIAGETRYVPGEQVGEIVPGRVALKLTAAEAGQLGRFEEPPPEVVILPEKASVLRRIGSRIGWKSRDG